MNHLGVYAFIINIAAGGGRAAKVRPTIERFMEVSGEDFRVVETVSPGEATRLAGEAAVRGQIPVAVGGDGSIHHVFSGILETLGAGSASPTFAILPVGTGNDLARMLDIPLRLEDSLTILRYGKTRAIDYGIVEWDGASGSGKRPFINVAGIGLDGRSALLAARLKPYIGNLCYTVAPALSVWGWKKAPAALEAEDESGEWFHWTGDLLLASVANGKWVGGGITISPDARVDDALLDLCLVRAMNPFRALAILPKAIKGFHTNLPEVDARQFRSMTISVSRGLPVHLDGEPCTLDAVKAQFSVAPAGVQIVAPPHGRSR